VKWLPPPGTPEKVRKGLRANNWVVQFGRMVLTAGIAGAWKVVLKQRWQ